MTDGLSAARAIRDGACSTRELAIRDVILAQRLPFGYDELQHLRINDTRVSLRVNEPGMSFPFSTFPRLTLVFFFIVYHHRQDQAEQVFTLRGRQESEGSRCSCALTPDGRLHWQAFGMRHSASLPRQLHLNTPYHVSITSDKGVAEICLIELDVHSELSSRLKHRQLEQPLEQSLHVVKECHQRKIEVIPTLLDMELNIGADSRRGGAPGLSDSGVGYFHVFRRVLSHDELQVVGCARTP